MKIKKSKNNEIVSISLSLLFACFLAVSCGELLGGGDDDDDETTDSSVPTPGSLSINSLSAAYPEGLSMTSFPDEVDSTPGEAAAGTLAIDLTHNEANLVEGDTDTTQRHPKKLLQESKDRLDGNADQCFTPGILRDLTFSPNIVDYCFGFDFGIVNGLALGAGDQGALMNAVNDLNNSNSSFSLTDLRNTINGLTKSVPVTGEACMIATSKLLITGATKKVEAALSLFEGMLCQAKKDGVTDSLPSSGSSINMTSVFGGFNSQGDITISSASIERLPDQDGSATYKSNVTFSLPNRDFEVSLVHSPNDDTNETYKGVLYLQSDANEENMNVGTSINYQKSGTTYDDSKLKYEVRSMVLASDLNLFNSTGQVDFESQAQEAQNDQLKGIRYFAFDINPSSYAGNLSFWMNPGGNYGEQARGFTFESTQNETTGALSGCAYAGAFKGGSIRKAKAENAVMKVNGCYTPFMSHGTCGVNGDNQGPQAWKQCFAQNTEGVYEVTTATADKYEVIDTGSATIPFVDLKDIQKVGSIQR